jgi:contactin associated protein-like 2
MVSRINAKHNNGNVSSFDSYFSIDLFNNVVTFRIADATINLPPFDMGHSGDIYFEFKTTTENAVLFQAKGPTDYIKLSIIGGKKLQFQYQAGSGPLGVNVETSYHLNDNNWHSVSVERNRKEARLVVDGALKAEVREPPGPVRALHLTSELVMGAAYGMTPKSKNLKKIV